MFDKMNRHEDSKKIYGKEKSKLVAYIGVFVALALICSYIESLIPFYFGVPGMKLGLTNVVVIVAMYVISAPMALLISVIRVFLAGIMFGNAFSIIYSLAGAVLSFLIMWLLKKSDKVSIFLISAMGGIFHNLGQVIVAAIVVENYNLLYYFFILMIAGAITGIIIGIVSSAIISRIGHTIR